LFDEKLELPFLASLKCESIGHVSSMNDRITFAFKVSRLLGACPSKYKCEKMFLAFGWLRCVVMPFKHGSVESFNNFITIMDANAMEFIHLNAHPYT